MKYKVGMYGGSFDPLHQGHIRCIIEAAGDCETLYLVLSYCRSRDSVPMEIRYRWLLNAFRHLPNVRVLTLEDHSPTKAQYTQAEWVKGADAIKALSGQPIDAVYCGSDYAESGRYETLYPESAIVYFDRTVSPVSSTDIRKNPLLAWDALPLIVRPYYVKRILIVGSESTGKSTLAQNLALRYNTNFVAEVGRDTCFEAGGEEYMIAEDMQKNILLQKAHEWDAIRHSNRLLFLDTDAVTTGFYIDFLLKGTSEEAACKRLSDAVSDINRFDLVLFLNPNVAFVQDGTRNEEIEADRERCSDMLRKMFDAHNIKYQILSGDYNDRFREAQKIIADTFNIQ